MMRKTQTAAMILLGILLTTGCAWAGNAADADSGETSDDAQQTMAQQEPEEPEPLIQTVTVTATGDCTLGAVQVHGYEGSFHQYYDNYGETYFFDGVRSVFENDDLTLINLECVLTNSNDRVEKTFNLKGRPEYTGIMTSSSIEACSLGNNHTADYGESSHADTENALNEAGIVFGYNEHTGVYTTEDGVTIGIVSASLLPQSAERENYIRDGIAALREQGVNLVIACCHWGIEQEHYPNDYQQDAAHRIIDWGADLVVGNHPHVLQGIEIYNGKLICYSLGNFCFGGNKNPNDKNTMMFQQTFTLIDGVLQPNIAANIIPCRLSSVTSRNDFQPVILSGEEKQHIIDLVNDYSAPFGSSFLIDGEGILQLPVLESNPPAAGSRAGNRLGRVHTGRADMKTHRDGFCRGAFILFPEVHAGLIRLQYRLFA